MESLGKYPSVHKERAHEKREKKRRALLRVANHLCPPPREKCARDLVEELRSVAGTDPLAWREFSFQTARMAPMNFQEALDCASIQLEAICIMRDFIQEHASSSHQDLTKRKYRTLFQSDASAMAESQPSSPTAAARGRSSDIKGKGKLTSSVSLGSEERKMAATTDGFFSFHTGT